MSFTCALNAAMIHGIAATTNHLNNPVSLLGVPDLYVGGQLIPARVTRGTHDYQDVWETFSDTDFSATWTDENGAELPSCDDSPGTVGWALELALKGHKVRPQGWKVHYEAVGELDTYGGPWVIILPNGTEVRATIPARAMRATWEVVE
jgi:hypothetical protein